MNSFIWGWSVVFSLVPHNSSISDSQTFLWLLFSLLILRLLGGDNWFSLLIFNSCSINIPCNVTYQPLAIPHKETRLFGATKLVVKGCCLVSQLQVSSLFIGAFEGRLWAPLNNAVRRGFVPNLGQGEKRERKLPFSKLAENVSKGYTPPTHSFQMIKDL